MQQSSNSTVTANLSNGFLKGACLSCFSPWNMDRKWTEKDWTSPVPSLPMSCCGGWMVPTFHYVCSNFWRENFLESFFHPASSASHAAPRHPSLAFLPLLFKGRFLEIIFLNLIHGHPQQCWNPASRRAATAAAQAGGRQLSIQLHYTCSCTAPNNPFPSAISTAERGRLCIKGSVLKRAEYFPRKISIQRKQSPKGTNWWTHRSTLRDLGTERSDQKGSWEIKMKGSTCNLNFWDRVSRASAYTLRVRDSSNSPWYARTLPTRQHMPSCTHTLIALRLFPVSIFASFLKYTVHTDTDL